MPEARQSQDEIDQAYKQAYIDALRAQGPQAHNPSFALVPDHSQKMLNQSKYSLVFLPSKKSKKKNPVRFVFDLGL